MASIGKDIYSLVVQADVQGGVNAIRTFSTNAKKDLKDVEGASSQMAANFVRVGAQVAAAGAAGLAALTAMGLSARKAAGEVLALQRVSGGSAEQVSKLRFAAQQTGVDIDALSTGLIRLSRNASSEKGADTLAKYGISARDAAGQVRPLGDLLAEVAGAVAALPNGAEKNDLVVSIFGRGGASLLPLLNRGADGLEQLGVKAGEFGAVLDTKTLEAAKRYTLAQRDLNAAVDGLKTSIGSDVLPTLTSVNEALAGVASSAARGFQSLPEEFRQTAVAGGLAVSAVASVGGTIASSLGSYGLAAQGVASLAGQYGSLGAAAAGVGGPLALLAAAIAGVTFAIAENSAQVRENIDLNVNASRIRQAVVLPQGPARTLATTELGRTLAKADFVAPRGPIDTITSTVDVWASKLGIVSNLYDDTSNRAEEAADAQRKLAAAIVGIPTAEAKAALDEVGAAMTAAGSSAAEVKSTLGPLYAQIGETAPIDEGTASVNAYAKAVEGAAAKGVTLSQALAGLRDGINPGELTVYADTLTSSLSPFEALIDANAKLEAAQSKAAAGAKRDTSQIDAAYKRLADAKQRLDDILRGDGTDTRQVSPEVQIADARRRIIEANARIAQNQKDDAALTLRDEALADLDRATNRRQQLNREAVQKEREVSDARKAVADAEADVRTARQKSDQEFTKAQQDYNREVLDAAVARRAAELKLADAIATGKVSIDDVKGQLQQLVAQGILPASVRDEFVGRLGSLATQAGLAAAALGAVAQSRPGPNGIAAGLPGSNVLGPPAPGTVPRTFVGPPAPGQTYQARTAPRAAVSGPDPLGPIRSLPSRPYTEGENRLGVPAEVQRLVNAANWSALIDIMSKRGAKFPGFAYGGIVGGNGGTDSQLIWATPGEGVVNPAGMRLLGAQGLARINGGQQPATVQGATTTVHETINAPITVVAPDPDRAASRAVRKLEQARRRSARRRAGVR